MYSKSKEDKRATMFTQIDFLVPYIGFGLEQIGKLDESFYDTALGKCDEIGKYLNIY